ncbi:FHA domain-containing protein [Dictyobacter formicarum]|uniref:FHA domain-containing protein n=1 Tax=Dictyobacter formicarum TaxID=2778368 RepID=A0ABQ3VKE3_9CHLR|nr:FHA domain-containing protein [Dictyobacter formicarum]GHO86293.1 hypothetical protein KSZ_42990 [Dictyobacter formicarum]
MKMEMGVSTPYRMFLQFLNGSLAHQRYEIPPSLSISIGSSLSDTIRIPSLQPGHAHIWQDHEHLMIGVSNVANYLAVNQKRTHRAELHDGDTITLGDFGVMLQLVVVRQVTNEQQIASRYTTNKQAINEPIDSAQPLPGTASADVGAGKGQFSHMMSRRAAPLPSSIEVETPAPEINLLLSTEVTRYLCMAAYSDEAFCDYVNNNIINEDVRAFGDTSGISVHTIARWALAARRRFIWRDMALVVAFVLGCWLIGPCFTIIGFMSYILPFVLAWAVIMFERCWCYYGPDVSKLRRNNFVLNTSSAALPTSIEWNLNMGLSQHPANVMVYSGFSPFAGSGINVKSWSFVVDIAKGKELLGKNAHPKPFTLSELYNTLAGDMKKLNLSNLLVEDKLYIDGKEIRERREFLPNPFAHPVTWLDDEIILKYKDCATSEPANISGQTGDDAIRYYQCYRIDSWQGDLVLSFFLRFYRTGNNLLIEGHYHVLPPIEERYREIDELRTRLDLRWLWNLFCRMAAPAYFMLILLTPYRLVGHILKDWLLIRRRRTQKEIEHKLTFDYGAATSLREMACSTTYQRHFQQLDKERYLKLIEYQLFASLTAFLDAHAIDSMQFRERQRAILNTSIIVS